MNIKSFLLKNLGIRQTIFKNTFWLAITEVIVQVLKLVLIVYTARILGAQDYGKFSFALSFVVLFVIFAEFGLPDIITREFSKDEGSEKEYPSIISLKIFLSAITFLLMFAGSFFITRDQAIRTSIWFLGIFILITSFLNVFYAFSRARQKMEYESVFKILQYVILSLLSFSVLFTVPTIENLSLAYFVSNGIILVLVAIFFHFFIQQMRLGYDIAVWKKFMRFSWPLILGFSIGWIYVPVSSVMLGYFGYHMENGWYNAAYKIIGAVAISAILISRSFFPVLSKFSSGSKETIQKIWNYQKEVMMVFAFPLMAGGIILAPKIISFFYDASFAPSVQMFQWLAVIFGIDLLYYPYGSALIIFGREKRGLTLIIIGLVINIALNVLLLPAYGLLGIVLSNLLSSVIVFLLAIIAVARHTPIFPLNLKLLKTFAAVIFSSACMYGILSIPKIYNLNLPAAIGMGAVVYFGILFICYGASNKGVYYKIKAMFQLP